MNPACRRKPPYAIHASSTTQRRGHASVHARRWRAGLLLGCELEPAHDGVLEPEVHATGGEQA
eukprot:15456928-Alexandrium_andersonii.AAC.1